MAEVELIEEAVGPVTVLRLRGVISDPGAMVRLARDLLDARLDGGHVVLDFDGVSVDDPAALCALLARLGSATGGVPVPTAVADPGMRRLLRACGSGPAGLACFPSVADAADVARPTVLSA